MRRISRKQTQGGGDQAASTVDEIPQRIFLYLQPKTIHYPIEDEEVLVEIELAHSNNTLTKLSDHYTHKNIIYLEEFNTEKPTFSITINQDDIADVTNLSDGPLMLTLFESYFKPLSNSNVSELAVENDILPTKLVEESMDEEPDELMIIERRAAAQGYIDLLEFFTKTRSRSLITAFLYPLPTSSHRLTCKMEWEIYSLHPLLQQLIFSNVVFITFGSLYNVDEQLVEDCNDMMVHLSFLATKPNENMQYDKVPICAFTAFSKNLIGDQTLNNTWENLKDKRIGNEHSMCIIAESKVNIQNLFHELLRTENVDFGIEDLNPSSDAALICNSLHRYILTDQMENSLEAVLAHNQFRIMVELMRDREPNMVLLQGFIDLSVFMFPQVSNCNFAIEMRPPGYNKPTLPLTKDNIPKNMKSKKKKRKDTAASNSETNRRSSVPVKEIPKEKIPFATIRICLDKPITEPRQDMLDRPKSEVKYRKYSKCPRKRQQYRIDLNLDDISEETYRGFDEFIREIVDYMLSNNIKSIDDNRQFHCSQLGNMTNKIMRLVACDFNIRIPTKTNVEFKNLMTVVYQELMNRIYRLSVQGIDNCTIAKAEIQKAIFTRLNIAKYMFEVDNSEMSDFIIDKLRSEYLENAMLCFYLFIYDVEKEDFKSAKSYLENSSKNMYPEVQLFINLTTIYITYKQALNDIDLCQLAEENLISVLYKFCENNPTNIYTWILLYCLYKKHNYLPGMEYCRWKYENLQNNPLFDLPTMPKSRWDIYMCHKLDFKSRKAQMYYKVVELFLKLGLYQFAEWIYDEIAIEAMEVEQYFMSYTFKIFLKKLEKNFKAKNFAVEKLTNPSYLSATLSQVNGNLEFFRNTTSAAMNYYALLCDLNELEKHGPFSLGLLRYAYHMMEEQNFSKAKEAFSLCSCSEDGICVVAAIGKGKSCYRLNDLDEAETAFGQSTQYGIYLPNVWAYLALINLKKGEIFKALECWKYARLNINEDIHEEILHELDKITYSNVNLFIDTPDVKAI